MNIAEVNNDYAKLLKIAHSIRQGNGETLEIFGLCTRFSQAKLEIPNKTRCIELYVK